MKRVIVCSIIGAMALAVFSQHAEAQRFWHWRRSYGPTYYNGYYSSYYPPISGAYSGSPYNNMDNAYYGGYYGGYYSPMSPVPATRIGTRQPEVIATPAPGAGSPQWPLLGPGETVISGDDVRALIVARYRPSLPRIVPGPAGSTSPNFNATANP